MISWNIHDDQRTSTSTTTTSSTPSTTSSRRQAIFRALHAAPGHLSRYLFEDIRVEDANWRLFYLILENNKWYDPALGYGQISSS